MNHIVPDFEMEAEGGSMPSSSGFFPQKSSAMQDDELVELLWRNGQVVMQNQNQRPPKKWPLSPLPPKVPGDGTVLPLPPDNPTNAGEAGPSAAAENQLFMQEDEMASWLHYPLDDSFDRDFCPDLLFPHPHLAGTSPVVADRRPENKSPASSSQPMMPPPPRRTESVPNKFVNFGHFSRMKVKDESQPPVSRKMCRESTVVDSSATPSVYPRASSSARASASGGETGFGGNLGSCSTYDAGTEREIDTCDLTVTSSSGGSGASADPSLKPPPAGEDRKRKAMECDDIEGQSEDAEYESVEDKKATRSASTRRTRAAEVHNLSERRRRDRINEKMKALQELIPRCNKTDKASMLDEAIEYLKSLQLQVQMMSMGCSMGPMMFPGVQQYMSMMGMGMGMGMGMDMPPGFSRPMLPLPPVLPSTSMPGMAATHIGPRLPVPPFHMPHVPQVDQPRPQATSHPDPAYNLVGLQSPNPLQMQNLADPYQYYLGFHHMQMPSQNQGVAQPPSTNNKGTETPEIHKSG